jgi:DNA-binding CsgD family transcriptional regulator
MLTVVGRPEFYSAIAAELCSLFGCGRYLALAYRRSSKPVFLFNRSFSRSASDIYLDSLYEHDPLYRTVQEGVPPRVMTLRSLDGAVPLSRYRAALLRHARIFDELAIMLPSPDGAAVAVCFNQDSGRFDPGVVRLAESIYPVLTQINRLHLERSTLPGQFDGRSVSCLGTRNAATHLNRCEAIEEFHGVHHLSAQERKVLILTMEGLPNRTIAAHLNLAFGTVKNYKRRLYRKLRVSSERALVHMVAEFLATRHGA